MKHLLLAFCSVFIMTACGGGGGGSTTPPATEEPAPVVVNDQTTDEEPAAAITLSRINAVDSVSGSEVITSNAESSSDIVVPNGFDLETEQVFNVGVNHPHSDTDAYLSVCTDYAIKADQTFDINYDSCLMRTSLEFQTFESEIAVTNDVTTLVAALWFMDTSLDPIYVEWVLADIVN